MSHESIHRQTLDNVLSYYYMTITENQVAILFQQLYREHAGPAGAIKVEIFSMEAKEILVLRPG